MYTFSKNLFETDKNTPMTFNITKCKDRDELKEYIEVCYIAPGFHTTLSFVD